MKNINLDKLGFNPAEAEDGFRRTMKYILIKCEIKVSIQPKPKTGLEENITLLHLTYTIVSIQPKPKTGLEVLQYLSY